MVLPSLPKPLHIRIFYYWIHRSIVFANNCLKLVSSHALFLLLSGFYISLHPHSCFSVFNYCLTSSVFTNFNLLFRPQTSHPHFHQPQHAKQQFFCHDFCIFPVLWQNVLCWPLVSPMGTELEPLTRAGLRSSIWSLEDLFPPPQGSAAGTSLLLGQPQDHDVSLWWGSPLLVIDAVWIQWRESLPLLNKPLAKSLSLCSILITSTQWAFLYIFWGMRKKGLKESS